FVCMAPLPPTSTLLPYTTLFRSVVTLKQSQIIAATFFKVPAMHRELVERRLIKDAQELSLKDLHRRCDRIADQWAPKPEVDKIEDRKSTRLNSSENLVCRLLLEK